MEGPSSLAQNEIWVEKWYMAYYHKRMLRLLVGRSLLQYFTPDQIKNLQAPKEIRLIKGTKAELKVNSRNGYSILCIKTPGGSTETSIEYYFRFSKEQSKDAETWLNMILIEIPDSIFYTDPGEDATASASFASTFRNPPVDSHLGDNEDGNFDASRQEARNSISSDGETAVDAIPVRREDIVSLASQDIPEAPSVSVNRRNKKEKNKNKIGSKSSENQNEGDGDEPPVYTVTLQNDEISPIDKWLLRLFFMLILFIYVNAKYIVTYGMSLGFGKTITLDHEVAKETAEYAETLPVWYSPVHCLFFNSPSFWLLLDYAKFTQAGTNSVVRAVVALGKQEFIKKYWIVVIPASIAMAISSISLLVHSIPFIGQTFKAIANKRGYLYIGLSLPLVIDSLMVYIGYGFQASFFISTYLWISLLCWVAAYSKFMEMTLRPFAMLISGAIMFYISSLSFIGSINANFVDKSILLQTKENNAYETNAIDNLISFIWIIAGLDARGNIYYRLKWILFAISLISFSVGLYMFKLLNMIRSVVTKISIIYKRGGERILHGALIIGFSLKLIVESIGNDSDREDVPSMFFLGCLLIMPGLNFFFLSSSFFVKEVLHWMQSNYYEVRNMFHSKVVLTVFQIICIYYCFCLNRFISWDEFCNFTFRKMISEVFMAAVTTSAFYLFYKFLAKDILKIISQNDPLMHRSTESHLVEVPIRMKLLAVSKNRRKIFTYGMMIMRIFFIFVYGFKSIDDYQTGNQPSNSLSLMYYRICDFIWIWLSALLTYLVFIHNEANRGYASLVNYDISVLPLANIAGIDYFSPSAMVLLISFTSCAYFLIMLYFDGTTFILGLIMDFMFAFISIIPGLLQLERLKGRLLESFQNIQNLSQLYPDTFKSLAFAIAPGFILCLTRRIEFVLIGFNLFIYGVSVASTELRWEKLTRFTLRCIRLERVLLECVRVGFMFAFSGIFMSNFIQRGGLGFFLASFATFTGAIYLLGDALNSESIKQVGRKLYNNFDLGIPRYVRHLLFERGLFRTVRNAIKNAINVFQSLSKGLVAFVNETVIPFSQFTSKQLSDIWDSPMKSAILSLFVLFLVYFADSLHLDVLLYDLTWFILTDYLEITPDVLYDMANLGGIYRASTQLIMKSILGVKDVVVSPYEWFITANQVSSISDASILLNVRSFAWAVYLCPLLAYKVFPNEVLGMKAFLYPLSFMIPVLGFSPSLFPYMLLLSLLYLVVYFVMSVVEVEQRNRSEEMFRVFRETRIDNAPPRADPEAVMTVLNYSSYITDEEIASDKDRNELCSICMEGNIGKNQDDSAINHDDQTARSVKLNNCQHVFHATCIHEWISQSALSDARCPNCRTLVEIQSGVVSALFR